MKIHKSFSDTVHLIIIAVLTLYGFFSALSRQSDFLSAVIQYVPLVIVSAVIIWAMVKSKGMVAYLLLLFTFYPNGINNFVTWFFSLFSNATTFNFELIIGLFITLFLLWMVIAFAFDGPKASKKTLNLEVMVLLGFVAYQMIFYGISNAMFMAMIPIIIYLFASDFLGLGFLLSRLIAVPFTFIYNLQNNYTITALYAVRTIFAIALLTFIIIALLSNTKRRGYNE